MKSLCILIAFFTLAVYATLFTLPPRLGHGDGDPLYYIHASRTLRAGEGLRNFPDAPPRTVEILGEPNGIFATWTPGFPVMLSLFEAPLVGAWVINSLALALSVVAILGLARDFGLPVIIAVGIAIAWMFSPPATIIYRSVWTEGAFVAISIVWIRAMLRAGEMQQMALLSIASTALFALRYVGAVFVMFGGLVVLVLSEDKLPKRLERVILYSWLPSLFMTWWLTRNWYSLGSFTGHRVTGDYDPAWTTLWTFEIIVDWMPQAVVIVGGAACVHYLWCFLSSFIHSRSSQAEHIHSSTTQANAS